MRGMELDNTFNQNDLKSMRFNLKTLTEQVQDMRKRLGVNVEEDTDTEEDTDEEEEDQR